MVSENDPNQPPSIGDRIAAEIAEEGLRLAKETIDARIAFRSVQSDLRVASAGFCAHEEMYEFSRNVNYAFAPVRDSDDCAKAIEQKWTAIYGLLRGIPELSKPAFDHLLRRMFVEAEKAAESRKQKPRINVSPLATTGLGKRHWRSAELPRDLQVFLEWADTSTDALQRASSASESQPNPPIDGAPGVSPYAAQLYSLTVAVDLDVLAQTLQESADEAERFDPELVEEIRSPAVGTFRFERGYSCAATTASKALLEAVPSAWHCLQQVVEKTDNQQERLVLLRSFDMWRLLPHGNIDECLTQIRREVEDTALARVRAQGDASGRTEGQDANATSDHSFTLEVRHRKILEGMLFLDATSRDKLQSADKIAMNVIDSRATSDAVKDELGQLKVAGLVESKTGRRGGYWLTKEGIAVAKKQ
jgi:hypothetical protein